MENIAIKKVSASFFKKKEAKKLFYPRARCWCGG
jgi:hypothetical protein